MPLSENREDMKFSVIIPTFNRAHFLGKAIDSVLSQTYPASQVIVVNDGSTDDTLSVLKRYEDRVHVLDKENGGKPSALNLALQHASGDIVYVLDDDDLAFPYTLETFAKTFEADSDAGFCYGARIAGYTHESGGIVFGDIEDFPSFDPGELYLRLLEECFVTHPCIAAKKSCYETVGYFDPNFIRSQDYEMLLRIARQFKGARIDRPVYIERHHTGVRGTSAKAIGIGDRNRLWLEYDQKAIRKATASMAIEDFVPVKERADLSRSGLLRQAHLQKATIMGRKALWAEAVENLEAGLNAAPDLPLSTTEKEILSRIFGVRLAVSQFVRDARAVRALAKACSGRAGRQAAFYLAQALYQRVPGVWGRKEYAAAARMVAAVLRILGIAGLMRFAKFRMGAAPL